MKKLLAVLLCITMLIPTLASCDRGPHQTDEDKGAVVSMYLTDEMYNFDPAIAYTNDSTIKILGMLYEGLMRINSSGKAEKALADTITYDKTLNKMQITLNSTKWSDGRDVTADDVIFAWKRLLEPDFDSEACSMLFDIKNARAVKAGDKTKDDLGLAAIETYVLEIEFEGEIDDKQFLENLASIALVPLREDVVAKDPENWSKKVADIKTNGTFMIRKLVYGDYMVIERSSYYYRNVEKDEVLDKYVKPYRLYIQFNMSEEEQLAAYNEGKIYYTGEIPLSERETYKDDAKVTDLLSTHTYYFNTSNKLFSNKNVRLALSAAIDREAIANLVVFAKPATALIPTGVFETTKSKDFRKNGGALLQTNADTEKAKSLLKEAGVSGGSFSISVRENDETSIAIAEYCKGVWEQLGFKVTVKKLGKTLQKVEEGSKIVLYDDDFTTAYQAGDFDIIAVDYQVLSTDPFVSLAQFAKQYSGQSVNENYDFMPHVTGFDNESYNNLIEGIFAEKVRANRVTQLHEAEQMLMDEMPIMPIIFNQSAYLSSKLLSGIKTTWFGYSDFTKMSMKNYNEYLPETTEEVVVTDDDETTAKKATTTATTTTAK